MQRQLNIPSVITFINIRFLPAEVLFSVPHLLFMLIFHDLLLIKVGQPEHQNSDFPLKCFFLNFSLHHP